MPNPLPPSYLAPGALIAGKYRLLRQVGEGAMGVVWAARNDATSGEVALKLLLHPDAELRQRLQREARAGALLKHRHILDVYDIGETGTREPFLVMQLLAGETLADLLSRSRRLEPPKAALIGRDIAKALAAAHAMKLVHRDLKPANVFLHQEPGEDEPVVKVLDFGVAKDLSSSDSLRTALGSIVGSLYYMSPEQARAQSDIDHRADLWALGVVLFEMITGVRPFQGDANQVFASIQNAEIPAVSKYVRRIDEGLVRVVAGCLKRDRSERYGSASEVAKLLNSFAADGTGAGAIAARPPMSSAPGDATVALPGATAALPDGDATVMLPQGPARPGAVLPAAPPPAVSPEETVTAVLPDATKPSRVGGGTVKLEVLKPPAAPDKAATTEKKKVAPPATEAADPASGRTSTEPLERPTGREAEGAFAGASVEADGSPKGGRRSKKAVLAAAGGISLGLVLSVAAFFLTQSRGNEASGEAAPQPPARPQEAQPATTGEPAAPPPVAPTKDPSATAVPPIEGSGTPAASAGAPPVLTGRLPEKDPCEGKTAVLLISCRQKEARERATKTYESEEGRKPEADPYDSKEDGKPESDAYGD